MAPLGAKNGLDSLLADCVAPEIETDQFLHAGLGEVLHSFLADIIAS